MEKYLEFNGYQIKYVLIRKPVKNINFRVKSDGILYISAGRSVPRSYIEALVKKNIKKFYEWSEIYHQQIVAEVNHRSSDSFRFLGRVIRIKVGGNGERYGLFGDELYVPSEIEEERSDFIRNWMSEQFRIIYNKANSDALKSFADHGYVLPEFTITLKKMKSRWGSCNASKRRISMNTLLMEYPEECIYSVFCHEYAHFFEQNHSPAFYRILLDVCPDYYSYHELLKLKNPAV